MKFGDRVIANLPDGLQSDVGEIIDGPIARNGIAAFKVRYSDFENWVPADWLKPFIRAVDDE